MARRYTKEDVETRYYRHNGTVPCVNVKAYDFPTPYKVEIEFGCTEATAEQAIDYCFQSHQERFWEDVPEWANEIFDDYQVKVYSVGRCGGYVCVEGLPDVAEWDAILLAKWRKFEKWCKAERDYLCAWETVKENIEANRWAEDGAKLYNFCDTPDGKTYCIADLNQHISAAVEAAKTEFINSL